MNGYKQETCSEKDLVLFHYGELDAGQRRRLLKHLENCRECRSRLAGLKRTLDSLPVPDISLTEMEKGRLSARITDRVAQRAQPRRWLWGTTLAAGCVLALSLWILPHGVGPVPGIPVQSDSELSMLQDMELLQNLDLLENLDLLQEPESNA